MESEGEAGAGAGPPESPRARPYVRFTAKVAREICWRTVAGETQAEICTDAHMPNPLTIYRWSKRRAGFARAYARARAVGAGAVMTRSRFCPVLANEIVARISEGELLSSITADAHLPCLSTVKRWAKDNPEFAEEMRLAREALAERFSDLGWKMALEATPGTAYLTRVQLGQLRWMAAVLGPRTHGRLKPSAPPEPPEVTTYLFRHFEIETHPDPNVRQHRVVGYTPDPETMQPVRDKDGPWVDIIDPVEKAAAVQALIDRRAAGLPMAPQAPGPGPADDDDPEGWC